MLPYGNIVNICLLSWENRHYTWNVNPQGFNEVLPTSQPRPQDITFPFDSGPIQCVDELLLCFKTIHLPTYCLSSERAEGSQRHATHLSL